MARRLSTIVGFAVLASALALLSAPAAVAAPNQPQTVTFTSAAPEGQDWFGGGFFAEYLASATASSGLPVTYSIDPASADVCTIVDDVAQGVLVEYLGAGTCTIHADQAGNDEYLPAEQATLSFDLDRVQPELIVLRQKNWPLRKRTFRATLSVPAAWNHWGWVEDGVVTFSVAGHPVCSGTMNDDTGVATCTATLSLVDWLRGSFVASFAGDKNYKPVSRKGPTVGDKDPALNEPW
jgi:hypothetical protein